MRALWLWACLLGLGLQLHSVGGFFKIEAFNLSGPRFTCYEAWKQRCDLPEHKWLVEYIDWHREQRANLGPNTTYLAYTCLIKGEVNAVPAGMQAILMRFWLLQITS